MDDDFKKKILVQRTDFEAVSSAIGKESVPMKYGGTMKAHHCPGNILADLAEHYEKEFQGSNLFFHYLTCSSHDF